MTVRRPAGRTSLAAPVATLLLLVTASYAAAQQRIAVLPEPGGTTVGISVMLGAGSVVEAGEELGAGHVAARAILEDLRPQLEALGAQIELTCDRASLQFTVLAPPSTWWVATDLLLEMILDAELTDRMIERARTVVHERLRAEAGNPEHHARAALQEALFGDDDPWGRAACGRPETIASLDAESIRRVRRSYFTPERTVAAVVGPIDEERASRLLGGALGDGTTPVRLPTEPPSPAPDRRVVERETVTAWSGLAFPLPDDADLTAVELLGFYLEDAFAPAPDRPDVYGITTRLERYGTGAALLVHLVTAPASADEWLERVRSRIRDLAADPVPNEAFQLLLQRYRGTRMVGLAAPEDRARDAVAQLFFDGAYHAPREQLERLDRARLRRAAARLGAPASARLGPAR